MARKRKNESRFWSIVKAKLPPNWKCYRPKIGTGTPGRKLDDVNSTPSSTPSIIRNTAIASQEFNIAEVPVRVSENAETSQNLQGTAKAPGSTCVTISSGILDAESERKQSSF